jgi:hypothetical protein
LRPCFKKTKKKVGHWWFTPVIVAAWEAEIGRIKVQNQSEQIVQETLSPK